VTLAATGGWVITPSVEKIAGEMNFNFPQFPTVLKGQPKVFGLTEQETEIARLAILFNLPRSNLAQELNRSPYTIYEYVHKAYEKLNLREILEQKITPEEYFAGDQVIFKYFGKHLSQLWGFSHKSKDIDTLAFHLLTIPEVL
jgi:DNA-binding CsgD family transcriptional regulator